MKPQLLAAALAAATCLGQPQAQPAGGPVGLVKRVSGQVLLERGGQPGQALVVGQALQQGDVVHTGRDGSAGITLADDTLLTTGPDAELVIDRFAFDSTTQDGHVLLKLWRGSMAMITGLIARRKPEAVQLQTRTVVLGVRGTEFIIDASPAPEVTK